jgi:hypothetical protein
MSTQCGSGSVSAGNSGEITGNRGTLTVFGDGELRVDPCCVRAWKVVDGHARRG